MDISLASTMIPVSGSSSSSGLSAKIQDQQEQDITDSRRNLADNDQEKTPFEKEFQEQTKASYSSMAPGSKILFRRKVKKYFTAEGKLRPFRLLRQDIGNIKKRYLSDWTTFNQLVFASAVYVFFTNILPGITFASDLYVLTGMTWGTIEVVFSTGLCGIIFSL